MAGDDGRGLELAEKASTGGITYRKRHDWRMPTRPVHVCCSSRTVRLLLAKVQGGSGTVAVSCGLLDVSRYPCRSAVRKGEAGW